MEILVSLCYLRLPVLYCFPNTVTKICNLSWGIYVPLLPAVALLPKYSHKICNLSEDTCVPVICGYPCYTLTQAHSLKFAIKVEVFVSLCYLRLPMLRCYPNTVTKICNLSRCICVLVLLANTRVTLLPKHSQYNSQFKWRYFCPCVTYSYPLFLDNLGILLSDYPFRHSLELPRF